MKTYKDNNQMFNAYNKVVDNSRNISRQNIISLTEKNAQIIKGPLGLALKHQITRYKQLLVLQESNKLSPSQKTELQQLEEKGLAAAMGAGARIGSAFGGVGAIPGAAIGAGLYGAGKVAGGIGKGLGKLGAGIGGMLSGKGFGAGVQQRNVSKNAMPAFQKAFAAMNKLRQMGVKIPNDIDGELKTVMQNAAKQYGVQAPQIPAGGAAAGGKDTSPQGKQKAAAKSAEQPGNKPDKELNRIGMNVGGATVERVTYQRELPDGTVIEYSITGGPGMGAPQPFDPRRPIDPKMVVATYGGPDQKGPAGVAKPPEPTPPAAGAQPPAGAQPAPVKPTGK